MCAVGILMVVGLGVFIGVVTGCSMLIVVIIVIKRSGSSCDNRILIGQ